MSRGDKLKWVSLASVFPSGLDTETDPTKLRDGYTPSSYNLNIDVPGRLASTTSTPAGTARLQTKYQTNYNWYFRRLWRAVNANLEYYAPEYTAVLYDQGISKVSFDEDYDLATQGDKNIITFFPVGNNMFVTKAAGGYMIPGASSLAGDFQHGDIEQAMYAATATHATELDGVAYVSNAKGVMAWNGGRVVEITEPVRNSVSNFASQALTVMYPEKRIICGTTGIYDSNFKKLFQYRASGGFLWTSPTMVDNSPRDPDGRRASFGVSKVEFIYSTSDNSSGELAYAIQLEDESAWSSNEIVYLEQAEGTRSRQYSAPEKPLISRKFKLRITSLDTNIRIHEINVLSDVTPEKETEGE